jgi:hypothetical protein
MRKYRTSKTAIHNYFNTIDSENKAYLLGFILADGCIEQGYGVNSISLRNAVDDLNIGELFQSEIFPGNKLSIRQNIGKKDSFSIKGSSKEIIKDLNSFNIFPNKTYDFNFIFPFQKLQNNFIRHFIRGFFDGDGTFTCYRFEFITTSKPFALQLIDLITNQFNCNYHLREKKTKNVTEYMFYFHTRHTNLTKFEFISNLHNWLYEDSTIYLQRKKSKFEMYLNTVLSKKSKKFLPV